MSTYSREDLKQYCLRDLGAPVVEINVDDQQLEDRMDEALDYWRLYHYDGIEKVYLKHMITQEDVDNKYIPMSPLVYGVTKIYPVGAGSSASKSIFDLQYQLRLNDLYDLSSTSIIYYTTVMQHLSTLDLLLNGHIMYRFNRLQDRLYLDINWHSDVYPNQYILVECYRAMDPDEYTKLWNEPWLKHYTTALFKRAWATNLKKFSGMQLPGGVTIDGDKLYDEAIGEIKDLQDELMNKSAPLQWFTG
ncbi:hypothetical protein UFOVP58_129 [uncultured Caudovirales phage]|uniref:Neck protein n=1 Tax=uncultured Caudovirales phage TaxID=2100421 RepID=A0A6J5KSE4_9CAUD|nr:hypothetical protein UFOVP58_129 [uncultured Caudovirales phage]